MSEIIALYESRTRIVLLLIGIIGFGCLCLWGAANPRSTFEMIFGLLCASFAMAATIFFVSRLFFRGPAVLIGPIGIFDRRIVDDWIRWDQISSIGTINFSVGLDPQMELFLQMKPDALGDRLHGSKTRAPLGTIIYISSIDLDGGFYALADAIMASKGRRLLNKPIHRPTP